MFHVDDGMIDKFKNLLNDASTSENDVQSFLEENSKLIPTPIILNHWLHFNCIISKLPISDSLICDFAYLTKSSDYWNLVLVELEDPKKKLFTGNLEQINFHSEFNKAYDQITAWKSYVEDNKEKVIEKIKLLKTPLEYNIVRVKYVLVIGRNKEKEGVERKTKMFAQKSNDDIRVMTYDSLISSYQSGSFPLQKMVLSKWREGFKVKSVPSDIDTSIFAYIKPEYLKIGNECKEELINQEYEIEKWENGEMLSINSKYTASTWKMRNTWFKPNP